MQEATKYCHYSQEYLSLRARSGKLKSLKFGRNWVTKKDWLKEYIGQAEEYKNGLNNRSNNQIHKVKVVVAPPDNLSVETAINPIRLPISFWGLRTGFLAAFVFALLLSSIVFGKESLEKSTENLNDGANLALRKIIKNSSYLPAAISPESFQTTFDVFKNYIRWLAGGAGNNFSNASYLTAETGEVFSGYGQWVSKKIFGVFSNRLCRITIWANPSNSDKRAC